MRYIHPDATPSKDIINDALAGSVRSGVVSAKLKESAIQASPM